MPVAFESFRIPLTSVLVYSGLILTNTQPNFIRAKIIIGNCNKFGNIIAIC